MRIMDTIGSPPVVVALGVTTILLLWTTFQIKKSLRADDGDATITTTTSKPCIDPEKYPGGNLTVYYGSQTGTAQMFAKQIASEGETRGFSCQVVDLQDVVEDNVVTNDDEEWDSIRKCLAEHEGEGRSKAVFLMATYGEGEATDNARRFIEILKEHTGRDIYGRDNGNEIKVERNEGIPDLDFAVFGLGNKQYEHYNNMSKFVDGALSALHATRIVPLGLGDDDDDLEGDFENWKDNILWPALIERYSNGTMFQGREEETMALPPCVYTVEYVEGGMARTKIEKDTIQTSSMHYVTAVDCPIVVSRELRHESDPGSTLHMEIDIANSELEYRTADNLGVMPKNNSRIVEQVAKALKFDLGRHFILHLNESETSSKHSLPFPTPCTIRECLERYCDLIGLPRRSELKQLAAYAMDDLDRNALLRMSSKEGKEEYKDKIVDGHVGIADIVTRLCPSIVISLEHFIMICPRLQPRFYTISSSSLTHPHTIHITFSITEIPKGDGGSFKGCCTGFLEQMKKGDVVRVFVRDSTFRLPTQVERPIIMIGPGTGIAPMRAILQERSFIRKSADLDEQHGDNILYFGCKKRSMDFIYRDELELLQTEGTLTELHLAFSRETEQKVYVQHLLSKQSACTWSLIHDKEASIFICGAVLMGADVIHTLQSIISEHGGMSRDEAKSYLDKLASSGRFVQELWS